MIINEEIRQACIDGAYEAAGIKIRKFLPVLSVVMSALEHLMTEAELAGDIRYVALCKLSGCLDEANNLNL